MICWARPDKELPSLASLFITQRSGAAGAWSSAVIAATVIAFCCSSVDAAQPPPMEGYRAASKIEYNSAKKQYLLSNRVGMYIKTGRIWRRYYWYCHL